MREHLPYGMIPAEVVDYRTILLFSGVPTMIPLFVLKKRWHLFEFEDCTWLPDQLRSLVTELLQFQLTFWQVYRPIVSKIKWVLLKTGNHHIIDLCSGGGGEILQIQALLSAQLGYLVPITLTDKYPNLRSFRQIHQLSQGQISYISESIDATNISEDIAGVRTLFTSFHHFPPETAKKILQTAARQRVPICIFEFTERKLSNLLSMIYYAPILVLFQTPFVRPIRWSRLFWTYVIPLALPIYCWDGFVSHLRTYSPEELYQLIAEVEHEKYTYKIGKLEQEHAPNLTYLIGYPEEQVDPH